MKNVIPTAKAFVGVAIILFGAAWLTAYLTGSKVSYFVYWLGLIPILTLKLYFDVNMLSKKQVKLHLICFGLIFGGLIVIIWRYFLV